MAWLALENDSFNLVTVGRELADHLGVERRALGKAAKLSSHELAQPRLVGLGLFFVLDLVVCRNTAVERGVGFLLQLRIENRGRRGLAVFAREAVQVFLGFSRQG